MIKSLSLKDVGPAKKLQFDFSSRLNVLTGDNGLGKTFILDTIWWIFTTTWAGEKAFPRRLNDNWATSEKIRSDKILPAISATLRGREDNEIGDFDVVNWSEWSWKTQEWFRRWDAIKRSAGPSIYKEQYNEAQLRPKNLVIYARIDGSYAIFDSHYASNDISNFSEAAIVLSASEVWDGKTVSDASLQGNKRTIISGLISDWVNWQQRADSPEFKALCKVLQELSPIGEPLIPAMPTRLHIRDRRDIPTIETSYGTVPITLASAGMKRALSLAYLLVWAWEEHLKASKTSHQKPTRDIILLIDEPELHQHPAWQRTFLPSLLKAVGMVAPNAAIQVFTATHSPLVLASLENLWDEDLDDLFVLERKEHLVNVNELSFSKGGDVTSWLASDAFGNISGRSREAELAINAARSFLAGDVTIAEEMLQRLDLSLRELKPNLFYSESKELSLSKRINNLLIEVLPSYDKFLQHWFLIYPPYNSEDNNA